MPFAAEAGHDFHRGNTLGQYRYGVAVGGEKPVAFAQAQGGCHLAGFLSMAGWVHGHAALANQCGVLVVDPATGHQSRVGFQQPGRARQRIFVAWLSALLIFWAQGAVRVQQVDHVACWQHVIFRGNPEFLADIRDAICVCVSAHVLPPFVVLARSMSTTACDSFHLNIICYQLWV